MLEDRLSRTMEVGTSVALEWGKEVAEGGYWRVQWSTVKDWNEGCLKHREKKTIEPEMKTVC